jgi:hypothetical protein
MMALTFSKKRQRRLPILRLLALAALAAVTLVLLLGSNAFSESKKIFSKTKLVEYILNDMGSGAEVHCIVGKQFLYIQQNNSGPIAVTQIYEERDGKALPAECKEVTD